MIQAGLNLMEFIYLIMNVVLVHIGPVLPQHLLYCIRQVRLFVSCPIHVLVSEAHVTKLKNLVADVQGLDIVAMEHIPKADIHYQFLRSSALANGFWQFASERFFYIYDYCIWKQLENIVHLENDNILYYDVTKLQAQFETKPLWAVFDSENRCIPSFVYIRNAASMDEFMTFFADSAMRNNNDMATIALFRQTYPDFIGALPIIANYITPLPPLYTEHASTFGVLFDGAAVGQYVGGVDIIHNKYNPDGFINETTIFQCDKVKIDWRIVNGNKVPFMNDLPLVNLHVHSKDMRRWACGLTEDIVTGERFQELCDVYCGLPGDFSYNPRIQTQTHKHLDLTTLNAPWANPMRIFCYGHTLSLFMSKQHFLLNPFVLVSHNSDQNITGEYLPLLQNPQLIHWYGQNVFMDHPKLSILPIGIANSMWGHGDLSVLSKFMRYTYKDKDVYFYFNSSTNPSERNDCMRQLQAKGLSFGTGKPYSEYLSDLAKHKFAICPDGNGVDSHRIWECYYLGVIPIVKSSVFTRKLSQWMPCIVLDSWDHFDISTCLQQYGSMYDELQRQVSALRVSVLGKMIRT